MSIEVDTGLEEAMKEHTAAVRANVVATRTTNAILLAQSMREDITEPLAAQKVLRFLSLVEKYVMSDGNE